MNTHLRDSDRAAALLEAQAKAAALFDAIERELLRPGVSERQLSHEIHDLAAERFDTETHWHRRVVRAGANTLRTFWEDPPDLTIRENDILFVDLGPVFEDWEADFGRTYVLGDDPAKHRLKNDLEPIFQRTKAYFKAHPDVSGEQLYATAVAFSEEAGWTFGGVIAGHLVGEFPHEPAPGKRAFQLIAPGNTAPLESVDSRGHRRHWILEIHLVDRARTIGGFYEELLTVG
jgi:Xaa-Pro aminopeptidase